jgi:long-chain acyl-CoA synthetase
MSLLIHDLTAERRGQLALADERVRLSWADLDLVANRAVNGLLALPFDRDRRVAIFAPNAAESVIAYLAGLLGGISTVPASFHLTAAELAYILHDSQASTLFCGPETLDKAIEAAREAGISTVIAWRSPPRDGVIAWEDWLAAASDVEPPVDMRPKPHLHYTSGTTGKPKGTDTPPGYFPPADTIAAYVAIMRERSALLPAGPSLVVGPLYHTGPLTSVRAVLGGTPLVTIEHFDPEAVLATIEREAIAGSVMVPTHFQRLLSLPDDVRARYDLSSMKRLAHTGAACPRDVKQRMIDWFGPVLVEAYGGTESGTTTMITSPEWLRKPGSVGRAVAPFEAVILGEDGSELGRGEVGQLFFRDTTGRGIVYHNDAEKTAAAHASPGVFTLGEMGYVDDEGYVFITDRISDMIVSGGVNIYPAEAEHVLLQHPDVEDVAVIGAPNAEMGEEAKALVIPADPASPPTVEALNAFCRERIAGYKCPRSYEFVDDIGRNAMGKVNKRALKMKYWPTDRTIGG